MSTLITVIQEHLIGPDWFENCAIKDTIALPWPLDSTTWTLTRPDSGRLKLHLTNPEVLPLPISAELVVRYTSTFSDHAIAKRVTAGTGSNYLIFNGVDQIAGEHVTNSINGRQSYLGVRVYYPIDIFKELVVKNTRIGKVIAAFNEDGVKALPPENLFSEDCESRLQDANSTINTVAPKPIRRSSRGISSDSIDLTEKNLIDYQTQLSHSFEVVFSNDFTSTNSQIFSASPFSTSLFQLRMFRSVSNTVRKCGLALRINETLQFAIPVIFTMKLTEDGTFCEEKTLLKAGENEVKSTRLQLQSYSLFNKVSGEDKRVKNKKFQVTSSVVILFPKQQIELFCQEFVMRQQLAEKIVKENPEEITIKVGKNQIKSHRGILATASPYFEAILSGSFLEGDSNEIFFSEADISFEVLKEVVEFIHTESCNAILSSIDVEMYEAAQYFGIERLQIISSNSIMGSLSPKKALHGMISAHKHHDKKLKTVAMEFVIRHLVKVQKLAMWPDLFKDHPDLINELLAETRKLVKYSKEAKDDKPKRPKLEHEIHYLSD